MTDERSTVHDGAPEIDGRRRDDIEAEVRERRPYYVDDWIPAEGDVGATMLALFADLAEEVTSRLDQVPEKHRVSFFETLGFSRLPPEPARVPVTVTVAARAGENVSVPAGTQAKAEGVDGSEQLFEVPAEGAFDATPATLEAVYSVDPARDAIFDHRGVVGGGSVQEFFPSSTSGNQQTHAFYIGDADQLSVGSESVIAVEFETDADWERLDQDLIWEFYGEKEIGEESLTGWHPFPSQIDFVNWLEAVDLRDLGPLLREQDISVVDLFAYAPDAVETLYPRLYAVYEGRLADLGWVRAPPEPTSGDVRVELQPNGTLESTTVADVESNWIRARIPPDAPVETRNRLLDLTFDATGQSSTYEPPVRVGASGDAIRPEKLLRNDVPLEGSTIRPFGERPRQGEVFYLASSDALTKAGATASIEIETKNDDHPHDPELSWEYFDGSGWSSLGAGDGWLWDRTDGLQKSGSVSFRVPDDLAATTVAGHEGHWVRVRLVGGSYGEQQTEEVEGSDPPRFRIVEAFDAPEITSVTLEYDELATPDHAIPENNLDVGPDQVAQEATRYRPFRRVPTDEQALYLGFDGPLSNGPINLFWELDDVAYPRSFHPRLKWEYYDAADDVWRRPDVRDGTEGLTEQGILGLVFPAETDEHRVFGEDRHWVRARVAGEPFGLDAGDESTEGPDTDGRPAGACGQFIETVPPAGTPRRHPPGVQGIYPNATWAENRRTIEAEVLGSSDGSVDQTVSVPNPPVVDIEVWVDELAVLSEGHRTELAARWPDRTVLETGSGDEPRAFWVRWEQRADLLQSEPSDRHFVLDPIAGTVSFGDGSQGHIPPRGSDNIRATYTTGGGAAGNVPAGAVSGLKQSLAFVEEVSNPIPAAAGSDAEETSAVTDRAARQLRDRNRAVAPADYERITMQASRELARARCLPGMDPEGDYTPGWITLLVVPDSDAERPTPSTTLRESITAAVAERAPTTVIESETLVVRGPSYVSVSVDADLAATGGSITQIEERATAAVRAFLHPLTGGEDGEGWPFGELPCRGDLFELLEGLDRVDHVERLTVRFETARSHVTVTEGRDAPDTAADALIYAGTQEITATLADRGGGGT